VILWTETLQKNQTITVNRKYSRPCVRIVQIYIAANYHQFRFDPVFSPTTLYVGFHNVIALTTYIQLKYHNCTKLKSSDVETGEWFTSGWTKFLQG